MGPGGSAQPVTPACGRGGAGQGSELDAERPSGPECLSSQPARLGLSLSSLLFLDSCRRQSEGGRCLGHLAPGPEQVCPLNSIYERNHSAEFLSQRVITAGVFQPLGRSVEVPKCQPAGSKSFPEASATGAEVPVIRKDAETDTGRYVHRP